MKTEKEIRSEIDKINKDERFHYPIANVFSNSPLALIQLEMETKYDTLHWVLGEPSPKINRNK